MKPDWMEAHLQMRLTAFNSQQSAILSRIAKSAECGAKDRALKNWKSDSFRVLKHIT